MISLARVRSTAQAQYLLAQMVSADFKLRYQGSFIGYMWSLVRPLALFTVLYFVFTRLFRLGESIPNYPVYLLLGIVLWTFFVEATTTGMRAITDRADMLRKVKVSRFTIIIAPVVVAFVNLLLSLLVVAGFMAASGSSLRLISVVFPLLLVELFVLAAAVSLILASLYVRFRDVVYIWELVTQVLFYATPIIYPVNLVPSVIARLVLLVNPMAQILQDSRYLLVTPRAQTPIDLLPPAAATIPYLLVAATLFLGVRYFRRRAASFAEEM